VIDLALYYATKRWPVFPLAAGAKVPAIPRARGGHGCLDATLNVERIEAMWLHFPNSNVGIATGKPSGLLAMDIDPRKAADWETSVKALELPKTFTVRTASGGFHLYFGLPADSTITIGIDLLPGIDWRGTGGYVVGAGSIVNGVTYEIVRAAPIAPAPTHLLDRIGAHGKRAAVPTRDDSGHMIIANGKRNDQMFRIGCALRRFGIDFNAIAESLRAVNLDHCTPPIEDDELRAIVASVMRYAPASASLVGARPQ
jgi:Bifunctional DNA primase/polymerase, N-terminal/Primase C terminal 1 (PriCT-1)